MTQLATELQILSPKLEALVYPKTRIHYKCFVTGDACFDVTHVLRPSGRVNPEAEEVPLFTEVNCEEALGMMYNYVNVLRKVFSKGDEVQHPEIIPSIEKHRYFYQESPGSVTKYLHRVDVEPPQKPCLVDLKEKDKFDFLVIADYNKGGVTNEIFTQLFDRCSGAVYVDTKRKDISMYPYTTVKMNSEEYERTREQHGLLYRIVYTKGEQGSEIIYPKAPHLNVSMPGSGVVPCNVSGAGDVFFATFIGAEQFLGLDEKDALILATVAAGISIQYTYTYIPKLEEIFNVLRTKSFRVR